MDPATEEPEPPVFVRRGNTGVRILLTLLFALIWAVVEPVLGIVVVFSLAWALIARQTPPERVRRVANSLVTYAYRIWRYLLYADAQVPFPFSEFPKPVEPLDELGEDTSAEVRELLEATPDDDR